MTKLSPAAFAVMDAVVKVYPAFPDEVAAAALRAAADQVVPKTELMPQQDLESRREAMEWGMKTQTQLTRQQLFAIAAELEAK
jgi:short subunit dehydrogenase-like uncharacterized protein